ncbi:MAG: chordopoxvirus fusion protein, partial [Armatimonadota bacterium]
AQRRTEQRLEELAEAQRRTEQRLEELAEAQRRAYEEYQEYRKQTDARFAELAEAQRRTEEALQVLAETVKDIQKQLGGLSQTVGYTLENEALKKLPKLLLRDHSLRVRGKLKRQYVKDRTGRDVEVNIFGIGERNGETVTIVGESKSQLSKNDIDRFLRRTIGGLEGVYPQILPVLVTHMISEPDAEEYARRLGVALYYSYDF